MHTRSDSDAGFQEEVSEKLFKLFPLRSDAVWSHGKPLDLVLVGEGARAFCYGPDRYSPLGSARKHLPVVRPDLRTRYFSLRDIHHISHGKKTSGSSVYELFSQPGFRRRTAPFPFRGVGSDVNMKEIHSNMRIYLVK